MDVISSETRSGLPSELLYADDLVFMAATMEPLNRCVAEWRSSLLDKGLKVNAEKSKEWLVVVVGDDCKLWKVALCVCGKGVQTNSVQCSLYKVDSQVVQWCMW